MTELQQTDSINFMHNTQLYLPSKAATIKNKQNKDKVAKSIAR